MLFYQLQSSFVIVLVKHKNESLRLIFVLKTCEKNYSVVSQDICFPGFVLVTGFLLKTGISPCIKKRVLNSLSSK